MERLKILLICILLLLVYFPVHAEKIFSYGFEDWGGTISTTSDYPFGSGESTYCTTHANSTEVVTVYDGHSAAEGSYFFMRNASSYTIDPSVSGITTGAINSYNQLGTGDSGLCGSNPWLVSIPTSEIIFVRFRFISDSASWANVRKSVGTTSRLKLIDVYNTSGNEPILLVDVNTSNDSPMWTLYVDDVGNNYYGPDQSDLFDGNWHNIAYMINFNTGYMAVWCDVDTPTVENATYSHTHTGILATTIDTISLSTNWSANNPTGAVWLGFDDIEIWDSLPDAEPSTANITGLKSMNGGTLH